MTQHDQNNPGNEAVVSLNEHELDTDQLEEVAGGVEAPADAALPCSVYIKD